MFPNETICVLKSGDSGQQIYNVGTVNGISTSIVVGTISFLGLIIKGFFIFYIKYEAPRERPINTMILSDQVSQLQHSNINFHF